MGTSVSKAQHNTTPLTSPQTPLIVTDPRYISVKPCTFQLASGSPKQMDVTEALSAIAYYKFKDIGQKDQYRRLLTDHKSKPILFFDRSGAYDTRYHFRGPDANDLFEMSFDWRDLAQKVTATAKLPSEEMDGNQHAVTLDGDWLGKDAIVWLETDTHDLPKEKIFIARIRSATTTKSSRTRPYFLDVAASVDTAFIVALCEATEAEMLNLQYKRNENMTTAIAEGWSMLGSSTMMN